MIKQLSNLAKLSKCIFRTVKAIVQDIMKMLLIATFNASLRVV